MKTWSLDGDNRQKALGALTQSVWFKSLEPAQLDTVLDMGELRGYEAGELILRQGEPSGAFYLLVKGEAKVEVVGAGSAEAEGTGGDASRDAGGDTGGETVELGRIWAPFNFGELGVLLDRPRTASITAVTPIIVLTFGSDSLARMMNGVPGFALNVTRSLATRLAKVSELVLPEYPSDRTPEAAAMELVPLSFMERHRILPLAVQDDRLQVGFVDAVTPEVTAGLRQHVLGLEIVPMQIDAERWNQALRARAGVDNWTAPKRATTTAKSYGDLSPRFAQLLERMVAEGASDLHLSPGRKPHWRIDGDMREIEDAPALGPDETLELLRPLLEPNQRKELEDHQDVDLGYTLRDVGRFRLNLYRTLRGHNAAIRLIPHNILTPQQLGLPGEVVARLVGQPHGLVLVTGATGSGKTTTLASIIDQINRRRAAHILSLEDPIEYLHEDKRAIVDQRQIGVHVESFVRGLRAALREDPDIILVGEIRDPATMELTLKAASAGTLVFATLHTSTVVRTLDLIVEMFPGDEQSQVRSTLADVLRGILSQRLLRRKGGGRVPAVEVMVTTPAIAHLVRDGRSSQIQSAMQTAKKDGNLLLNEALVKLVEKGLVDRGEAEHHALDKNNLQKRFERDA